MKYKQLTLAAGVCVLSASLLLPGCASKYGEQITKVNYYPQCYQPIKDLRADENAVAKSTAAGAATGAVAGAIIGGLATGDAKGALVGAVAGAATGAVAGNIYGKQQQQKRDAAFLAKYAQMLDEDIASSTRVIAAAKVARKCYNDEFKKATAMFKAQQISKKEYADKYQEIRTGLQEVSYVLNQRYNAMIEKDKEYEAALGTDFTKAKEAALAKKKSRKKQPAHIAKTIQREQKKEEMKSEETGITEDLNNLEVAFNLSQKEYS